MRIAEIQDYKLVHENTGEILNVEIHVRKSHIGGCYMILNQDTMKYLREHNPRGESLKVLNYLFETMGYDNVLPLNKKIAKELNMDSSNVARALKQLAEITAIVKEDNESSYVLNPYWGFKGSQIQRKALIKRLQDKGVKL